MLANAEKQRVGSRPSPKLRVVSRNGRLLSGVELLARAHHSQSGKMVEADSRRGSGEDRGRAAKPRCKFGQPISRKFNRTLIKIHEEEGALDTRG